MNTYIVVLKGTNKELSTFEITELWRLYTKEDITLYHLKGTYYYFNSNTSIPLDSPFFKRITLTNSLCKVLYEGDSFDEFKKTVSNTNFSHLENASFGIFGQCFDEVPLFSITQIADCIWNQITKPRVNLDNPDFKYRTLFYNSYFYFCEELFENKKKYLSRMPKLRPVAKPYTLKSDMARVAINYLGIKQGVIVDPFCGIGGILLEAYEMGFECYGNDISWNDLQDLKTNFTYYFPDYKIHLSICDAREQFLQKNSIDGIVTDIPYGKSSRRLGFDLYRQFLYNASIMLKPNHRLVVVFANFIEFRDIATEYFHCVREVNQYINKSLTRHILVLENTKKTLYTHK